jgi:CRISPR-associated protein (TIGR02584 family)
MNRNILLAVTGLIQKPIVQALWYFCSQKNIRFDEIIVLTTSHGETALRSEKAGNSQSFIGGILPQFYKEYDLKPMKLTVIPMKTSTENKIGVEKIRTSTKIIDDVRKEEELEIAAYSIIDTIRTMSLEDSDTLYCIYSGGRRVMASYLTSALTLIGKNNCHLYYLDVEPEEVLRNPEFYYPPKKPSEYSTSKGTVRSTDIKIRTVEVVFPKLGEKFQDTVRIDKTYKDVVKHIQDYISNEKKPIYVSHNPVSRKPIIIGNNKSLLQAIKDLEKFAVKSADQVLLLGETGTGKEIFAEYFNYFYYQHHPELKAKKIVTINCGSIPEHLIESELYGFYKGAHSEAKKDTKGKLEEADNGIAFLDEVHTISPRAQAALLRFLENREIQKLGQSDKDGPSIINIEAIVLLGTNEDLDRLVVEGKVRRDFYGRIRMMDVYIPPLRERKEDIKLLAKYFIDQECAKRNIPPLDLSPALYEQLEAYDWPDNVRELRDFITLTVQLTEESNIITKFPRPEKIAGTQRLSLGKVSYETILREIIGPEWNTLGYDQRRDALNRWMLSKEYESCEYNASELGRKFGESASTMQTRLDKLGIKNPMRPLKKRERPPDIP